MRPLAKDHIPYFSQYIDLVPEGDIISALKANHQTVLDFIEDIPRQKLNYFYGISETTVFKAII